jgi:hypothetical protein
MFKSGLKGKKIDTNQTADPGGRNFAGSDPGIYAHHVAI